MRVHQQKSAGFRDSLAVQVEALGDARAIWNEFSAHGQRIVHTGFAAGLFVVRLARDRCERNTQQDGRKYNAHFHSSLLTDHDTDGIALKRKEVLVKQERNE
ncbi:MAG: hypothetical protein WB677_04460 [Xanthobacteraceae bacterium]